MRAATALRIAIGLAILAAGVAGLIWLPIKDYAQSFIPWVEGMGPWGPALVVAIYIPACVLFIPGSLITLGTGAIFGVVLGTITISIASTLGATAAFLTGRTIARGLIEERVARHPQFAAIDRAVAEQGFKIVLLTRLSPVLPFVLLNYAFGLTRVRLRDFVLASWIGMLPGTVMYVYLGSALGDLASVLANADRVGQNSWARVLFFVGLVVAAGVTVLVTRIARQALRQAVESAESGVS